MDLQLTKIIESNGLEKTQGQMILDNFTEFFKEASEWESKAKLIVITDVSQVEEMKEAKKARKALQRIRLNAEDTRKNLKERSLREGKAIDGIANVIKALVVPIEEYLEKQEKFIEHLEEEKKEKIFADRVSELQQYVSDTNMYNLRDMSNEGFAELLKNSKFAFDAQKEAEAKAETERLEKEKADEEERERIRIENEKLKEEARIAEVARLKREKEIEEERKKKEVEAEAERKEAQRKIDEAKRKQDEAEVELKRKAQEEEQARIIKEKEEARAKKEAEEAERQAALAPEKDKLIAWADLIKTIESPKDLSEDGQAIVKIVEKKLLELSQEIKDKAKSL